MFVYKTIREVEEFVAFQHDKGKRIGFVPTMGALHAGHISLVERSVSDNDVTVVSVFVNPTQFNNPADLATYPRKEEEDIKLLAEAGATVVFMPSVEEIYGSGDLASREKHEFKLGQVAEVMEGARRPGHFQGVAEIVSRLFRLVRPQRAYFGEKDFQQIAVIREMVRSEGLEVEIVPCPIKRAEDGLALSSRNALLSAEQRAVAPEIHRALAESVDYSHSHSVKATHDTVTERLDSMPHLKVEYFEIVDGRTLQPIDEWEESPWVVGCITVYCGEVRLIDNITYRGPQD